MYTLGELQSLLYRQRMDCGFEAIRTIMSIPELKNNNELKTKVDTACRSAIFAVPNIKEETKDGI